MEWIVSLRAEWLTPIFKAFTFLGDEEFFLMFLPLGYWLWRKNLMGRLGIILLFSVVLNALIKGIFQIPRPDMYEHLVEADGWSFPSGHSQSAMVLWGWLAWELKNRRATLAALILILGVGLSRVYLGVHFPIDVIGGYFIGFVSLLLYTVILRFKPAGWMILGPTRQSLILFVLLMGLFMISPEISETANKGGAAFLGFLAGVLHEKRYLKMIQKDGMGYLLTKIVTGLTGILILWIGLKQIFISIGYVTDMATFIRYTLLGGWISFGAPYLFIHFGWSDSGK